MSQRGDVIVSGHLCLDLIPEITTASESLASLLVPGGLVQAGPMKASTGGAVGNTGVALHKLGLRVKMVGKVGDDPFGEVLLSLIRAHSPHLAEGMIVSPESHTSYTVIIEPPGIDRAFIHYPGANDTFQAGEVPDQAFEGAYLLHFGYPPLMRRFFIDNGAETRRLFERARKHRLVTSLDMSMPDPESEAGRCDWRRFLENVLPQVDLFLPSLDEIGFMLGIEATPTTPALLDSVSEWLFEAGAGVVVIKLGEQGLFLRTTSDVERLKDLRTLGVSDVNSWGGRELLTPCYETQVAGTTGAGDCTIAGFLAELAQGSSPEQCLSFATAAGASSVESPDATSGIKPKELLLKRLKEGWRKKPLLDAFEKWQCIEEHQVFASPMDTAL